MQKTNPTKKFVFSKNDWRVACNEAIQKNAVIFVIQTQKQYIPWDGKMGAMRCKHG